MYVLSIPKDICFWNCDQKVYITNKTVDKKEWILLYNYLDYNIYYEYEPRESGCIYPHFLFGNNYIKKFIEVLLNIEKPYPIEMLAYFKENNIIIPDNFTYELTDEY